MTFADTVAAHVSTNYTAGIKSAGMIFDNIEDKSRSQWEQANSFDVVQVIEQTGTLSSGGWGHIDLMEAADIRVYSRVKGASANVKARLTVIMDEVEHTLHWKNHAISGYSFHLCTSRKDASDRDKISSAGNPTAYGHMTMVAFKHGRTA